MPIWWLMIHMGIPTSATSIWAFCYSLKINIYTLLNLLTGAAYIGPSWWPPLYGKLYGAVVIGENPLKEFADKYDVDPGCADPAWKIERNQYLSNILFFFCAYSLCYLSQIFFCKSKIIDITIMQPHKK